MKKAQISLSSKKEKQRRGKSTHPTGKQALSVIMIEGYDMLTNHLAEVLRNKDNEIFNIT